MIATPQLSRPHRVCQIVWLRVSRALIEIVASWLESLYLSVLGAFFFYLWFKKAVEAFSALLLRANGTNGMVRTLAFSAKVLFIFTRLKDGKLIDGRVYLFNLVYDIVGGLYDMKDSFTS